MYDHEKLYDQIVSCPHMDTLIVQMINQIEFVQEKIQAKITCNL